MKGVCIGAAFWLRRGGVLALLAILTACGGDSTSGVSTADAAGRVSGLAAEVPHYDPSVTGLILVSEVRVSRTTFDYVFKVTLKGGTASAESVVATIQSVGVGTTVIDGVAQAGAVAAGASVESTDTIRLRVDRSRPFQVEAIRWALAARAVVDSVKLTPGSVTFTAVGQSIPLVAKALDSAGREVLGAPIALTSSAPQHVSVEGAVAVARSSLGSAALIATSGPISSAPVVASIVTTVAGARPISDADVLSPFESITSGSIAAGQPYTALLRSSAVPPVGTIVLATGESGVSGRVTGVQPAGNGSTLVTLVTLPLEDLYERLDINIDVPVEFIPDAALSSTTAGSQLRMRALGAGGPRAAASVLSGLLDCKAELPGAVHVLKASPTLEVANARFIHRTKVDAGIVSLQVGVHGDYALGISAEFAITAPLNTGYTCTSSSVKIPAPGLNAFGLAGAFIPLRFISGVTGKIDVGISVRVEGTAKYKGFTGVQQKVPVPLLLPWVDVTPVENKTTVEFLPTLPLLGGAQVTLEGYVGIGTGIEVGIAVLSGKLVEIDLKAHAKTKYGSIETVINDETFQATDNIDFVITARPGGASTIGRVLSYLTIDHISQASLEAEFSTPIDSSPTALSILANTESYTVGQNVQFDVRLDPTSLGFLTIDYNVSEVRIYKLSYSSNDSYVVGATMLEPMPALPIQNTRFSRVWIATEDGTITRPSGKPNFYAMIVPKFMAPLRDLFPVELGPVQGASSGQWVVVDLPLPPGTSRSSACAMNSRGDVAGRVIHDTLNILQPVRWIKTANGSYQASIENWPRNDGSTSFTDICGIDGLGRVTRRIWDGNKYYVARWDAGNVTELQTPSGVFGAVVSGVNDSGIVVGYGGVVSGSQVGIVWKDFTSITLTTLGGAIYTTPAGVSDNGAIVGTVTFADSSVSQVVVWQGASYASAPKALRQPDGLFNVYGAAINSLGNVVGYGYRQVDPALPNPFNVPRAEPLFWRGDKVDVLPVLTPRSSAYVTSINNANVAVGSDAELIQDIFGNVYAAINRPVLWRDGGEIVDLMQKSNMVQKGWLGGSAISINNRSEITVNSGSGAFVLVPK